LPICVSWCRSNEGGKTGHDYNRQQQECVVFHEGSSIEFASVDGNPQAKLLQH
jgi:hypothetical protein